MHLRNRLRDLHAHMGSAIWAVQGAEMILAKYYVIVFQLVGAPRQTEILREFEYNFAHTAGRLLGLIRDKRGEDEFVRRIGAFVDERGWLVHRIRHVDLRSMDEGSFQELLTRIKSIEAEASGLIQVLHQLLIDHFVSLGLSAEVMAIDLKQELQESGSLYP